MAHPWEDAVRLGIVHFMACPEVMGGEGPVAATAEALLADGFFTVLEVGPIHDAGERAKVERLARARGATLAVGVQPALLGKKLNLNAPDPADRAKAMDAVRAGLAQARVLGAAGIAVLSGPDVPEADRPAAMEVLAEALTALALEAAPLPVHLEVFDFDVDKKCLIGPTHRAVELAKRVRLAAPNFGIMLDLSHLPLQHERTDLALAEAKEVLTHAHVGNCVVRDRAHPRYGDQHPRFGIEGGENGVAELADFLSHLFRIGYLKRGAPRIVSIEVKPGPGETTADLVAHTRRTWDEAWGRVKAL